MKLMTQTLEKRFQAIGQQLASDDPIIVCKFFTPWSNRTRYVSEWYPEARVCFGFIVGQEAERWYFALPELETITSPYGLGIERDIHFGECLFSQIEEYKSLAL